MNREKQIYLTEQFTKATVADYDSGHDWWHVTRVRKMALYINSREETADPFILEIASLLHDSADSKFSDDNTEKRYGDIQNFMSEAGMSEISVRVLEVIKNVSFSNRNASANLNDPVLLIVQDADRLDALGAIGIARAFNYGGFRNRPIHVPGTSNSLINQSTIFHFYDKLLKLKDMMNTPTGRIIARERHDFLEIYLRQFYEEWDFAK
jgi:uncharacterized protein